MRWTARLLFLALFFPSLTVTRAVFAEDPSLVVLGLRSLEGDDEFANSATDALRVAVKATHGWDSRDRAVSMSQMVLSYNCDDIDVACLAQISHGLDVDRVIYGTIRRTAAPVKYNYEITVSLFNGVTRTVVGTEIQTIDRSEGKKAVTRAAQSVVARLARSESNVGRLAVEVNVLTADVRLDDQLIGQTQERKLTLDSVPAGEHMLEISASGHQSRKQALLIRAGELSEVGMTLERTPDASEAAAHVPMEAIESNSARQDNQDHGSSLSWLGYTLIGVGAASAIAWGASMYVIEFQYNQDSTFQTYKNAYQFRRQDACTAALSGDNAGDKLDVNQLSDFQGRCRAGRTWAVLQWVFLGAAVVAAGAGTFVLLTDSSGKSDQPASEQARLPSFELQPQVDPRTLALHATLRF
jgi:hypothetical protein